MKFPSLPSVQIALVSSLVLLTACTETPDQPAQRTSVRLSAASERAPEYLPPAPVGQPPYGQPAPGGTAALEGAKQKVRDLNFEIGRAESERRQLSPPIRITDSRGTTFDKEKQAQYERAVARIDRRISELRREKTIWELRVNELSR